MSSAGTREGRFERMLTALPAIAEVVNTFKSEAVQQRAFDSLLSALEGRSDGSTPGQGTESGGGASATRIHTPDGAAGAARGDRRSPRASAKGKAKARTGIIADLSLRPPGKQAFVAFAQEKAPRNHYEKIAVAVYYLKVVLDAAAVTADHVNTCYQEANWKRPANLVNMMQQVASKYGWLDTSDMKAVVLTTRGEDQVRHDLPPKAAKANE